MNNELKNFLELLKTDVINSMQANGRYASGQTAGQITIVEDGDNLQLKFPAHILALENGRTPTGSSAVTANPPMIQRIQEWCSTKGIPDKAAWAIKKSIDKKGYKGTAEIISEPLGEENINIRLNPELDEIANAIRETIIGSIR